MRNNVKVQTISREVVNDPSETTRQVPHLHEYRAYLLGALHDGTYNKYNQRYRIAQKGIEWLQILKILVQIIGYTSWIYKEGKNRSVYVLETKASFLDVNHDPKQFTSLYEKRGYVRGFFDAEGGIPCHKNSRFYIQLTQKNKEKIQSIKSFLNEFQISTGKIHNPSYRIDPDYWRIFVLTKSHNDFVKKICSWHPRKRKYLEERNMI